MTFYWWSHWFWITMMNILFLLPLIAVVNSYPSQDAALEYNKHQTDSSRKMVTKLYQASSTWVTESSLAAKTSATEKTILQSVAMSESQLSSSTTGAIAIATSTQMIYSKSADYEDYYEDPEEEEGEMAKETEGPITEREMETKTQQIDLEAVEEDMEAQDHQASASHNDGKENDIKRSAEHFSQTEGGDHTAPAATAEEHSNYTNFTSNISTNATVLHSSLNVTSNISSNRTSLHSRAADALAAASVASAPVVSQLTVRSNATATPTLPGPLDWLSSVADVAVSPPTARSTTDSNDANDDKFPFTLENVHKSEDLISEESGPRTRKSKGLTAEYKQPYINYSSDSKNLLTRAASTTVNEYESEENNISSEALSVQRAYMMDVGAISAICFTVFGVCCTVGTIGIVLYRRRYLNKPQALSEPDSSVYIDDSTMRVSDNSDEMYSLDNDSFLNSLEAMTIQNYWTDTVKHTKL